MPTTQTQHLQKIILSIASDIDKICRENNIDYYLFGGTALGAKRHQGFIPWDDDLDICFLPEYYDKFIALCKEKLDKNKYQLQEGLVDWPEHFSKIRLKGTHIREYGEYFVNEDSDGIYVDVFRVDYASDLLWGRRLQYLWGKLLLTYNMSLKGYKADTVTKKIIGAVSRILRIPKIKTFVERQYYKYNGRKTNWTSDVMGRTRFHNAFIPMSVYGKPSDVKFEDKVFTAHENLHEYLRISFGDYMKLPPVDKRVGLHITEIDFGEY